MSDQLPLLGPRGGLRPRPERRTEPAGDRRVQVLIDSRVPHLDRVFDYSVPEHLSGRVTLGGRVRVRLSGRVLPGFVVGESTDGFEGKVSPIDAAVSPVPVLAPEVLELSREVARHYAGSVSDVIRLAVPPRVAAAEEEWRPVAQVAVPASGPTGSWLAGRPFVQRVAQGTPARAAWACPPTTDWAREIADAAHLVAGSGRGVVVVVPDGRDVDRLAALLGRRLPLGALSVLRADDPNRYSEFLSVLSGGPRVLVGTRAAAFAPLKDVGLFVIWDDGDPVHADLHAPYPHAREVLAFRSHLETAGLLIAGFARTCEAQRWVDEGWLHELDDRQRTLAVRPRVTSPLDHVRSPFDETRRFPAAAVEVIRRGLADGPVLVQVARRGYVPVTACARCRTPARCVLCGGPIQIAANGARTVSCGRCGDSSPFTCPECGSTRLRAVRVGAGRTGTELESLFPGVPIHLSTSEHPHSGEPRGIVVATPGLEPPADHGYSALYLPDAQSDLWRHEVRARENALRRWLNAAALLRPGAAVSIAADGEDAVVQAFVRWDPIAFARAELGIRAEMSLPPARQVVQLDGAEADVESVIGSLRRQRDEVIVLGPRPLEEDPRQRVRALLSAVDSAWLTRAIRECVVARSAAVSGDSVRVQVDPVVID